MITRGVTTEDDLPWDGPPAEELLRRALLQPGARRRRIGVKFACPACREICPNCGERHDKDGDSALVRTDGRFGCAVNAGHRRAIAIALGVIVPDGPDGVMPGPEVKVTAAESRCGLDGELLMTTTAVPKKARGRSHVTKLINLVLNSGAELFRSPEGDLYVTVPHGDHQETFSLTDRTMKEWLARAYFIATKAGVSGSALSDALIALSGGARAQGIERPVYTRVAAIESRVYLDLVRATIRCSRSPLTDGR